MAKYIHASITLVIIALIGCSTKITPTPETVSWPATTKIPIHAGLYYSPKFAEHEYTRKSGPHTWTVTIGSASIKLYDDMLPRVLEKTSRISNLSWDEVNKQGINVVLSPTLEHFDFRMGMDSDRDRYSVSYRTTLYNIRGVPLASWVVSGNAQTKFMGSIGSWIEDDMNDAAIKFLNGFEGNAGPALKAIAKNSVTQPVPFASDKVVLTAKQSELPGLEPKQASVLKEGGIVAFTITVQSNFDRELTVRASDMSLIMKNNQSVEPLSLSSGLSFLDQTSHAGEVVAGLLGAPIGVLVTYLEESSKQSEREMQTKSIGTLLFGEKMLSKGKKESGLVIFHLPKDMKPDEIKMLKAWVVDINAADGAQVEISL